VYATFGVAASDWFTSGWGHVTIADMDDVRQIETRAQPRHGARWPRWLPNSWSGEHARRATLPARVRTLPDAALPHPAATQVPTPRRRGGPVGAGPIFILRGDLEAARGQDTRPEQRLGHCGMFGRNWSSVGCRRRRLGIPLGRSPLGKLADQMGTPARSKLVMNKWQRNGHALTRALAMARMPRSRSWRRCRPGSAQAAWAKRRRVSQGEGR
jgi:hypothetical protein